MNDFSPGSVSAFIILAAIYPLLCMEVASKALVKGSLSRNINEVRQINMTGYITFAFNLPKILKVVYAKLKIKKGKR